MYTKKSDYTWIDVSDIDIAGQIIPVADVSNVQPALRMEDQVYLWQAAREFLQSNKNFYLSYAPTDRRVRPSMLVYLYEAIYDLMSPSYNMHKDREYNYGCLLREDFDASFRGQQKVFWIDSSLQSYYQFCQSQGWWMQNYPTTKKKVYPDYRLRADYARELYWLLSIPVWRSMTLKPTAINDTSYRILRSGPLQPCPTKWWTSKQSANLQCYDGFASDGDGETVMGVVTSRSATDQHGDAMLLTNLRDYDASGFEYVMKLNGITEDFYDKVDLQKTNIEAAYALVQYNASRTDSNTHTYRLVLEPMTNVSGTEWSFKFADRQLMADFLLDVGVDISTAETRYTGMHPPRGSCHASMNCVLVKYNQPWWFDIGWQWSP